MNRAHALTLGVLAALVIAVTVPRSLHHVPPTVPPPGAATSAAPPAPSRNAAESAARATHPGIGFHSYERLAEHFRSHGRDFGARDAAVYLTLAQALRDRAAHGDVLELRRADGVITRFDRASGAFIAFDADLTIRTFFKPRDGEAYFRRQAERDPR